MFIKHFTLQRKYNCLFIYIDINFLCYFVSNISMHYFPWIKRLNIMKYKYSDLSHCLKVDQLNYCTHSSHCNKSRVSLCVCDASIIIACGSRSRTLGRILRLFNPMKTSYVTTFYTLLSLSGKYNSSSLYNFTKITNLFTQQEKFSISYIPVTMELTKVCVTSVNCWTSVTDTAVAMTMGHANSVVINCVVDVDTLKLIDTSTFT